MTPKQFQHTAARRRLPNPLNASSGSEKFQHTAARRRLRALGAPDGLLINRFNTQPPEGGCTCGKTWDRPRAGFNTQPPEGGCVNLYRVVKTHLVSTHSRPKAAASDGVQRLQALSVSTHSRPKAAAFTFWAIW